MTKKEIVKALRICSRVDKDDNCADCALGGIECGCVADLMSAAADLIENQAREIDALTKANVTKTEEAERHRWVPVEEALPKPFVSVLGYMPEEDPLPTVHECYYADVRGGEWFSMWCYGAKEVTHWMPMPETPGDGE